MDIRTARRRVEGALVARDRPRRAARVALADRTPIAHAAPPCPGPSSRPCLDAAARPSPSHGGCPCPPHRASAGRPELPPPSRPKRRSMRPYGPAAGAQIIRRFRLRGSFGESPRSTAPSPPPFGPGREVPSRRTFQARSEARPRQAPPPCRGGMGPRAEQDTQPSDRVLKSDAPRPACAKGRMTENGEQPQDHEVHGDPRSRLALAACHRDVRPSPVGTTLGRGVAGRFGPRPGRPRRLRSAPRAHAFNGRDLRAAPWRQGRPGLSRHNSPEKEKAGPVPRGPAWRRGAR